MPAFPGRHDRALRAPSTGTPIEQWRAPNPYPSVIKGALIGGALGTVMWVAAGVVVYVVARWWT